jgi:hypothetical protein
MRFGMKNILKSNHNHIPKQASGSYIAELVYKCGNDFLLL